MPLADAQTHGTNADGSTSAEYCTYCYQNGAFTQDCTMDEMIAFCVPHMTSANAGMTEQEATRTMAEFFPTLKRWR
jgi:hypothetical protein